MSTLFGIAAIKARMATEAYRRAFDREGTNVTGDIDAFAQQCCDDAESEVTMRLGASFPQALTANGAVVDLGIVRNLVRLALALAVELNPSAFEDTGPFVAGRKLAYEFFDRLFRDDRNRVRTAAGGPAQPRARANNTTNATGTPTDPFTRSADGSDKTGF
jgi:hypothetical protein